MIPIPEDVLASIPIPRYKCGTNVKGLQALRIVKEMLRRGLIPISMGVTVVSDMEMQIAGTDIIVTAHARIQVKCDYMAGPESLGGSGNLYLQTHECNPFRKH